MKNLTKIIVFILSINIVFAQYKYDKNYFLFPIKPGKTNLLAGNMGEIRGNHFHGGLDIKTEQRTGLPVYASADGYVSRIVLSNKGYGNTLYITHPNGLTTVYAHLERFNFTIGNYIRKYLYDAQCNETDHYMMKNLLKVKKGDTIAFSGNTGSSGGPHLHWEIRDENEKLLNPLFFNFSEIEDHTPPIISKVALKPYGINSSVNGEFERFEFSPIKVGNEYQFNTPINAFGKIGLEIITYDKIDNSYNLCGISSMEVIVDGKRTFYHNIQKVGFEENPYVNLHIDFEISKTKGNVYQKCYKSDGNELSTYETDKNNGFLIVLDSSSHIVKVIIKDAYHNTTDLSFAIRGSKASLLKYTIFKSKTSITNSVIQSKIVENILKITYLSLGKDTPKAELFIKGKSYPLTRKYLKPYEHTYLWDLRLGLPDSIKIDKVKKELNFRDMVSSSEPHQYFGKDFDVYFPKGAGFDTLYMYGKLVGDIFSIHNFVTPLAIPVSITLKPIIQPKLKNKTHAYSVMANGGLRFIGGDWDGDKFKFKTKTLGDFKLVTDTVAPKITLIRKDSKHISFKITDYPAGINHWYAYLNGKFLLMHFDSKNNTIFSELEYSSQILKGELVVVVVDGAGNKGILKQQL